MLEKCNEQLQFQILQKVNEIYKVIKKHSGSTINDLLDGYAGIYLFQSVYEKTYQYKVKPFNIKNIIYESDKFGLGFSGQIWVDLFINPKRKENYDDFIVYLDSQLILLNLTF